ncbi:UDP-glucuronosyl/UDP-glucosyltransferase [Artemisia annua]|uniref:UDP-glucuronosyl/UDP-glucosyltransferase n=1 Tax=Artemisia annua TaxID=35608 RepID=A0A2U1Q3R4_ARTAN|nr:UDP-glucuronosyl/UDP-glucosyltransferase [Artemisia annua]
MAIKKSEGYKDRTTLGIHIPVEIVTADEIESGIRRLMEDKEVRKKVKEISEKCRATVVEGGSSYASVGHLIQDFMRNISCI